MTAPTINNPRHSDYTAVLHLAGHWCSIHVQSSKISFISKSPEKQLKTAQKVAAQYAQSKQIPFEENPVELNKPCITVWREGTKWYPAELHPTCIRGITKCGPFDLGGTVEEAKTYADVIAVDRGVNFFPQIGESCFSE